MHYQTLLLAALATFSNAAAAPPQLSLSHGTVSADLAILANTIAISGPSTSSIAAYKKAYADLVKFQTATGDTPYHPCPPLSLGAVKDKKTAEEYIEKTEEIATGAFKGALGAKSGAQICQAEEYLSLVGEYVGA